MRIAAWRRASGRDVRAVATRRGVSAFDPKTRRDEKRRDDTRRDETKTRAKRRDDDDDDRTCAACGSGRRATSSIRFVVARVCVVRPTSASGAAPGNAPTKSIAKPSCAVDTHPGATDRRRGRFRGQSTDRRRRGACFLFLFDSIRFVRVF